MLRLTSQKAVEKLSRCLSVGVVFFLACIVASIAVSPLTDLYLFSWSIWIELTLVVAILPAMVCGVTAVIQERRARRRMSAKTFVISGCLVGVAIKCLLPVSTLLANVSWSPVHATSSQPNEIELQWNPCAGADYYELYREDAQIHFSLAYMLAMRHLPPFPIIQTFQTTASDSHGLTVGRPYCYVVLARNGHVTKTVGAIEAVAGERTRHQWQNAWLSCLLNHPLAELIFPWAVIQAVDQVLLNWKRTNAKARGFPLGPSAL